MNRLGITTGHRYRTVDKTDIIEHLLCYGWPHEVRWGGRDSAVRQAQDVLDEVIGLGLACRNGPDGRQRFDPAEVENFIRWLAKHEQGGSWVPQFVTSERKLVREIHQRACAKNLARPGSLPPQQFSVTLKREFNLRLAPGAQVRLRAPFPLEDQSLRGLTLKSLRAPDLVADPAVAPGRIEGRFTVPQNGIVAIAWTASFTAYAMTAGRPLAPLQPSESELYTRSSENLIRVSPRIRALADSLAGSLRDPWTVVHRFWDFMLERLTPGVIHFDEVDRAHPGDWVLENGWYDCPLGSSLLVALCRARGIAARVIGGYMLYPDRPRFHAWIEFWDDARGWVPVDTMAAGLSAGGRDPRWRDYYFGELDYRMKTECLPRLFTGMPTVRVPAVWHSLARVRDGGVEVGIFDTGSGAPVYRDHVVVERLNATPL